MSGPNTSSQDARPVWLYDFARGSRVWKITTDKNDYLADTGLYEAVLGGIQCDDIETSQDHIRNNPEAIVNREMVIAEMFRAATPTDVISVRAREVTRGESDYRIRFVGEVAGCKWDGAKAKLQFINIVEAANALGLKVACAKGCQANLFGVGCNLADYDWDHDTVIDVIDGLTVTVNSVDPALPYQGGEIRVADAYGNYDRRMIIGQDGNILTLARRLPDNIIVTDAANLLPGCNHAIDGHCLTVYNNTDNYRGRSHFAGKSPMDGKAVF